MSQAQEHGLENPRAILCASKRISTAIEAHEHLNNLFASEEWTQGHAEKTVGQYVALWRDSSSIERPRTNVDHGCCEDIRESRSFLATSSSGKGIVLMRTSLAFKIVPGTKTTLSGWPSWSIVSGATGTHTSTSVCRRGTSRSSTMESQLA